MKALARWLIMLAAPPHVGEALVGDFEERGDDPWRMLCSVPTLVSMQLRRRGAQISLAALAAWVPLVAAEALARFVLSQVPLKADAGLPAAYAIGGIVISAAASAAVLIAQLQPKGD